MQPFSDRRRAIVYGRSIPGRLGHPNDTAARFDEVRILFARLTESARSGGKRVGSVSTHAAGPDHHMPE